MLRKPTSSFRSAPLPRTGPMLGQKDSQPPAHRLSVRMNCPRAKLSWCSLGTPQAMGELSSSFCGGLSSPHCHTTRNTLMLGPIHSWLTTSGSNMRSTAPFKITTEEMSQGRICAPDGNSQMGPSPCWQSSQSLGRQIRGEHRGGKLTPMEDGKAPCRR